MAREFKRADRVADALQRSIAGILRSDIRDPRIGMPNINAVVVPRDLSSAKVYTTFIGLDDPDAIEDAVRALNEAAGYIRTLLAKEINMRIVPRISFVYDRVAVEGQQLSNLIDRAVASDHANRSSDLDDGSDPTSGEGH